MMERYPDAATWIESTFGDFINLGGGAYGNAALIAYNGRLSTLKWTESDAEVFCVETLASLQENQLDNIHFPFPFIYLYGTIMLFQRRFFYYVREYAEPLHHLLPEIRYGLPLHMRRSDIELYEIGVKQLMDQITDAAYKIYLSYGLVMIDLSPTNWGEVKRSNEALIVPIDLACGNSEHWWEDQEVETPFAKPVWLINQQRRN